MRRLLIPADPVTPEGVTDLQRHFFANGIVRLPRLLTQADQLVVRRETSDLLERCGQRRDFNMAQTDNTPRHMRNVGGVDILRGSPTLCGLYENEALRSLVSSIVGEPTMTCPYEMERMVIASLHKRGDTHGWHWDDYSLALVWVLDAPPPDCGGVLQCIPHTHWNRSAPDIMKHMIFNSIRTYHFNSGEAYLMQTRETLHRVYPIVKDGVERVILNFAFATAADLRAVDSHETVEALWSNVA